MIKHILVPVAFSKYSRGILDYAAELAEPLGAKLEVVNVISDRDLEAVNRISSFGYKVDVEKYLELVRKERWEQITGMAAHLTLPDEQVNFTFLIGDPSEELLRFVVESEIDLVVMGIKSRDIAQMFAGSVAERMFRRCPVPVLSWRGEDVARRLEKRILKHLHDD